MTVKGGGLLVSLVLLGGASTALADQPNDITVAQLEVDDTGRFIVRAAGNVSCSFSSGTGSTSQPEAVVLDGAGVALTADMRKEAVTLLTSAYLAGKTVLLTLRRSDTNGVHCNVMKVRVH